MSEAHTNIVQVVGRAEILAAAEALYRRDGPDAVSLSAVAREAGLSRSEIYSYFTSREDLIAAVAPQPAVAGEAESYDSLMQAQADALHEISQQVIVPKGRTTNETALSRIEARLSVVENSQKALELRVNDRMKGLDVETGALAERLHGLRQRLEKFEEKQLAALAQIRLDVHNLQHAPQHPAAAPAPTPELAEPIQEIPVLENANDEDGVVRDEAGDETDAATQESQPSVRVAAYLAAARQAAADAEARRAAMPVQKKPAWLKFAGKRRWALLAVAAALVGWFDTYVFAHYQPAHGEDVPAAVAAARPQGVTGTGDGSARAQLIRGLRYMNGEGVPADLAKGRMWIEQAARRGQPVAANLMGAMYQSGSGVAVNMQAAAGWYEGAANRGNLKAMTNLGKLYAGGWPQGTDFSKASQWFARAAAYGDVDAAFDLAILYERGEGVVRNVMQAYKWYAIAGRLGDRHAAERAETLADKLPEDERAAADAAVTGFRPKAADKAANETPRIAG